MWEAEDDLAVMAAGWELYYCSQDPADSFDAGL
jgi:hypothetical protein